jgi:hypothetical protein
MYVKVVQPPALPAALFSPILSTVTTILTFQEIRCDSFMSLSLVLQFTGW